MQIGKNERQLISPQPLTDAETFASRLWTALQETDVAQFLTEDSPAVQSLISVGSNYLDQSHDSTIEVPTSEHLLGHAITVCLLARKLLIDQNANIQDLFGLAMIMSLALSVIAEVMMTGPCDDQLLLRTGATETWPDAITFFHVQLAILVPSQTHSLSAETLEQIHAGVLRPGFFIDKALKQDASDEQ